MSNGLHKIELRRGKSNGYRYMYEVVAVFVSGEEQVLFASPSYIECCKYEPRIGPTCTV